MTEIEKRPTIKEMEKQQAKAYVIEAETNYTSKMQFVFCRGLSECRRHGNETPTSDQVVVEAILSDCFDRIYFNEPGLNEKIADEMRPVWMRMVKLGRQGYLNAITKKPNVTLADLDKMIL